MANIIQIGKMWYADMRMPCDGLHCATPENKEPHKHRIRRALSKFKEQAEARRDDLVELRKVQKYGGRVENISWYTFREKYMRFRSANKKPRTYAADVLAVKRLEEAFPAIQSLRQVTPELLEDARIRWQESGVKIYAVAKAMRCLKQMMRQAEAWKFISPLDWRSIKVRKDRKRVIYYTTEQYRTMLDLCEEPWKTAALLMGRAGLRPEEARYLEWSDIDFENRTVEIRIKENFDWKPKMSTEDSPHERSIDMPMDLEAHLKAMPQAHRFVLGPVIIKYDTYKQYFVRLAEKANLEGFAYAFRHTYASHLISNGASLSEVGSLLGHTDYRSTQIYAHMMPHARRTAVDRLPPI